MCRKQAPAPPTIEPSWPILNITPLDSAADRCLNYIPGSNEAVRVE